MAINYTKIGWDTTKYVNPTSMNQMDDGIKAACDGVDGISANYIKANNNVLQKIALSTSGAGGTVLQLQGRATATWIQFLNASGTSLGYIGVDSNNKPAFYDTASHEIVLKEVSSASSAPFSMYKFGRMATLIMQSGTVDIDSGGYLAVNGTRVSITSEYRPIVAVDFVDTVEATTRLRLGTDGTIRVYNKTGTGISMRFAITYPTAS